MDAYEATRVVFSRIQAMDPENAAKVMGLLLIQDHGEKEMIRLAFGPDALLRSVVAKARSDLGLLPPASPSPLLLPTSPPRMLAVPSPTSWPPLQPGGGSGDLVNQLPGNAAAYMGGVSYPEECRSPSSGGDAMLLPYWGVNGLHRHGCSELGPPEPGLGWRPCHYYARGYCKNGSTCRFLHGLLPDDAASSDLDAAVEQQCQLLLRSKSQRLVGTPFPYSPTAAALMLGGNENHIVRSPRMERDDLLNPSARQIYLTFPADSSFREEDVSNYFSIYGPVQDVRIPYQQKRMFGFVTFLYPETVKLILAKGNPHFVCDSRVLVKPYKEKGKVPDKYRMQRQHGERGDFSGCNTSTALDARDPYDLQQLGSRIMYSNQDALLRRKLEEQQQAVELQQAIELQSRRFMGLQLLDLKNRSFSSPMINATTAHLSPSITVAIPAISIAPPDARSGGGSREGSPPTDKSLSSASGGEQELPHMASGNADVEANLDGNFQESCVEHNLPDSPFASPTNSPSIIANGSSGANHLVPSFNSCFFQMPRFSGHGAIGM